LTSGLTRNLYGQIIGRRGKGGKADSRTLYPIYKEKGFNYKKAHNKNLGGKDL